MNCFLYFFRLNTLNWQKYVLSIFFLFPTCRDDMKILSRFLCHSKGNRFSFKKHFVFKAHIKLASFGVWFCRISFAFFLSHLEFLTRISLKLFQTKATNEVLHHKISRISVLQSENVFLCSFCIEKKNLKQKLFLFFLLLARFGFYFASI